MDDAARPKKGRLLAAILLVVVSLGIFVAALFLTGGLDLITGFLSGDKPSAANNSPVPPKPQTNPPSDPAEEAPGVEPASNADLSEQRAWMYWEQVDSQEAIGELVAGKWAEFTVTNVSKTSSEASIRLSGRYESGATLSGTMVLRPLDQNWYFTKITRRGNTSPGPAGRPGADTSVIDTIVSEQSEPSNQAVLDGLMNGGYTKVRVESVAEGSGTATIDLTFSGGNKGTRAGRIVCISKTINGRKHWFVTRCEER